MNSAQGTSVKEAQEWAQRALTTMKDRGIAPTPDNYVIWYKYVANKDAKLVKEIDTAIREKVKFDDSMNSYLYDKYAIAADTPFPADKEIDTKAMLADVLSVLNDFKDEAQTYNDAMDAHVKELETKGNDIDVSTLVQEIVGIATSLKKSGEDLHKNLNDSQQEIEQLRENLAKATTEAERDFLTGVFNRKALDKMISDLMELADETNTSLCLLMVDIDHFKHFNDEYGHLIGDEVLKMVSKIMTDTVKGKDIVARFGGEEFGILLPSTPIGGAMIVAETIRKAVASKELRHKSTGETFGCVTVSIGVSCYRHHQDTAPVFIKRADDALYRSKRSGRNRVTQEELEHAAVS